MSFRANRIVPKNDAAPLSWTNHITVDEPHVIVRSATKMYFVSPSNCLQTSAWSDKLQQMLLAPPGASQSSTTIRPASPRNLAAVVRAAVAVL